MAIISIKSRREPIELENDRAQKVKNRWLGINGAVKADPHETLDLGVWAGEYNKIGSIEMTTERKPVVEVDTGAEARAEEARWAKMTAEQKSKFTGFFKLHYGSKNSWKEPPADILIKAEAIQLKYFAENPEAMRVPSDLFKDIVGNKPAVSPTESLAKKMTEDTKPRNPQIPF